MAGKKFKAALQRAFKKHLPSHIYERLKFIDYQEWETYKQIRFSIISKDLESDCDKWPINLELLNSLKNLFQSSEIYIKGGSDSNAHEYYHEKDSAITITIKNANFGQVLTGKHRGLPYDKPLARFDFEEDENDSFGY